MKMKFKDAKPILDSIENEIELSQRSEEINVLLENKVVREIVTALKATLEKENLVSLSAPAIGYQKRIFCIKFKEEIKTFINPVIIKAEGLQLSREHCSSMKDKEFIVPRNNDITVMYQKPLGKIETRQIVGLSAFVFQHELQHLDGVLLSDFGLELDENWDSFSDEEKETIIGWYLDSLDMKEKEIKREINEDEDAKQLSDAIDFIESVNSGETILDKATGA